MKIIDAFLKKSALGADAREIIRDSSYSPDALDAALNDRAERYVVLKLPPAASSVCERAAKTGFRFAETQARMERDLLEGDVNDLRKGPLADLLYAEMSGSDCEGWTRSWTTVYSVRTGSLLSRVFHSNSQRPL
ncbi:MAG: hypothetical protein K2H64_05625 [Desulfovibrio sp.]|nr:hypothetical protein [Desulfovibrio sp.]